MNRQEMLLVQLMEECDEVSQRASKALRFGLQEIQPGQDLTNVDRLFEEIQDLSAITHMLRNEGVLPTLRVRDEAIKAKIAKVERFLDYSRGCGTLKD